MVLQVGNGNAATYQIAALVLLHLMFQFTQELKTTQKQAK